MKIAFASKDGLHVNQHFGWCEVFYIYTLNADGYAFVGTSDASQEQENETEKLLYKLSSLEGCDIVCVEQIGPKAATMVQSAQIYPLQVTNCTSRIEDVLCKLLSQLQENPPLWLKRILLKESAQ